MTTWVSPDVAFQELFQMLIHKFLPDELDAFLLSHKHLAQDCQTTNLMKVWTTMYSESSPHLQERLINFLKMWLQKYPSDITEKQISQLISLLKNEPAMVNDLKLLLLRGRQPKEALKKEEPRTNKVTETDFMTLTEADIARELTLYEFDLFKKVNVRDLVSVHSATHASLFDGIISHFNSVSYWVATEILMTKSRKQQVLVLEKLIRLAKYCLQLNNFNSFMEVISGLNHNAIQRLKGLWELVSPRPLKMFQEMDELMGPISNFRLYRTELKKRKGPTLPYFGIFLRDFTFINDGNELYKKDGSINVELMMLFYEKVQEVRFYQSTPYEFLLHSSVVQEFVTHLPLISSDEELYMLSLKCQPSLWIDPLHNVETEEGSDISSEASSLNSSGIFGRSEVILLEGKQDSGRNGDDDTLSRKDLSLCSNDESMQSDDETIDDDEPGPFQPPEEEQDSERLRERTEMKNEIKKSREKSLTNPKQTQVNSSPPPIPISGSIARRKFKVRTGISQLVESADSQQQAEQRCQTVDAPPPFTPLLCAAEQIVGKYFAQCYQSHKTGTIGIFDERYLLLRASSLSVDFFSSVAENFVHLTKDNKDKEELAHRILFDLSHSVGKSDARNFIKKMKLAPGIEALSAGPVHFAYTGWAFVRLTKANPTPSEDAWLFYDHPFSFEAHSWINRQKEGHCYPSHPVCVMNAGYSSGWTSVSMADTPLVAVEVMCRARGDEECRFIMSHPSKINAFLDAFFKENNFSEEKKKAIILSEYLSSKEMSAFTSGISSSPALLRKGSLVRMIFSQRMSKTKGSDKGSPAGEESSTKPNNNNHKNKDKNKDKDRSFLIEESNLSRKPLKQLFKKQKFDPRHGSVMVGDERCLFIRGEAISYEFFTLLKEMFPEDQKELSATFAANMLFDVAKCLGKTDAAYFVNKIGFHNGKTTLEKMLSLPTVLCYMGWGVMYLDKQLCRFDFSRDCKDFLVKFDLQRSFEADVWIKKQKEESANAEADTPRTTSSSSSNKSPVCLMNAGYITGYLNQCMKTRDSASVGKKGKKEKSVKLSVVEVSCKALGHSSSCEFLVAPSNKIEKVTRKYLERQQREAFLPHVRLFLAQKA